MEYIDWLNSYQYVQSRPHILSDPLGLAPALVYPVFGPSTLVVSWIDDFDVDMGLVEAMWDEYSRFHNHPPLSDKEYRLLFQALLDLALSANPEPPNSFIPATWDAFVQSKEYRGWMRLDMAIWCNACTQTILAVHRIDESSHGYTPLRRIKGDIPAPVYLSGEGRFRGTVSGGVGFKCVTVNRIHDFRIGPFGQKIANILTGAGVPWAWHGINYKLCCDGTTNVSFSGSFFPSHKSYMGAFNQKSWNMIGKRIQGNLAGFTFAGNGVVAPGGDF